MFVIAEKYHVITSLGSGGMGAVYEALHAGTGRRVAVKMLRHEIAWSESARERFVREAHAAGALTSPHVVEIFDAGTDTVSGLPYLVMELLEGPNLRELVHRRGRVPVGLLLVVAAQVASGLHEAHQAGIIHRDVKPANIVLSSARSGELVAKIVDFGVAKAVEDGGSGLTKTGDVIGSLQYMSPEQLTGAPATPRSDIWSLGVVMYEALSGVRPTTGEGETLGEIVRRTCEQEIAPLADVAPWVPPDVAAVVHRALKYDPVERFSSAHAMHEAIRMLLPNGLHVRASVLADGAQIVVAGAPASESPAARLLSRGPLLIAGALSVVTVSALLVHAQSAPRALTPKASAAIPMTGSATATAVATVTSPIATPRNTVEPKEGPSDVKRAESPEADPPASVGRAALRSITGTGGISVSTQRTLWRAPAWAGRRSARALRSRQGGRRATIRGLDRARAGLQRRRMRELPRETGRRRWGLSLSNRVRRVRLEGHVRRSVRAPLHGRLHFA